MRRAARAGGPKPRPPECRTGLFSQSSQHFGPRVALRQADCQLIALVSNQFNGISISLYDGTHPMNDPAAHLPFDALNAALKAAGEATRLRVLALVAEAELTVSDLTDILRQSQPRISRHLKLLVEAGLVERFREG